METVMSNSLIIGASGGVPVNYSLNYTIQNLLNRQLPDPPAVIGLYVIIFMVGKKKRDI